MIITKTLPVPDVFSSPGLARFQLTAPGVNRNRSTPSARGLGALRLGYVPLTDAAPLLAARAWSHLARAGVEAELSAEIGWATIREKLAGGELDGAHLPAPMAVALHAGLDGDPASLFPVAIASWQGNAITLSARSLREGAADARSFGRWVRSRAPRLTVLASVASRSMHSALLELWLRAAGLEGSRLVKRVVLPPAQMARSLAAGLIDGYCAGEPWNAVAVAAGSGWVAATSRSLLPGHVEKIVVLRAEVASAFPAQAAALARGLAEAAAECSTPEGRRRLLPLLAASEGLDLPEATLAAALLGPFPDGDGRALGPGEFHLFVGPSGNRPDAAARDAILGTMADTGMLPPDGPSREAAASLFGPAPDRRAARSPRTTKPANRTKQTIHAS